MFEFPSIDLVFAAFRISTRDVASASQSSAFEDKVLSFVRDWVSGNSRFEFQTSGSTGPPRKISFKREQLQASARLTQNYFQLKRGYKALLCLDPDFVAAKMMIVRALEIGMELHCFPPIASPIENLNEPIDFGAFVPYQLEAILSTGSTEKINLIKTAIVGGSAVPDSLLQKLQPLRTQFFETYGMTETLTHIAVRKLNPAQNEFRALAGIKVAADDDHCLLIKADHLGNELIRTNDLVELTSESTFKIVGRSDNIINTAGVKISPESLERKIAPFLERTLPGHSYFIAGQGDKIFGERIVLYIETDKIKRSTKRQLFFDLKSNLMKWEVPKEIITVAVFKRTSSGKVNRKATQHN